MLKYWSLNKALCHGSIHLGGRDGIFYFNNNNVFICCYSVLWAVFMCLRMSKGKVNESSLKFMMQLIGRNINDVPMYETCVLSEGVLIVTQISDCFRPVLDMRESVYEIHTIAWFGENGNPSV